MSKGDSELVTTAETLQMLGVGRTTLYRMIDDGELAPVPGNPLKRKQPRYFRREDIERLLKEGRKPKA